MAQCNQALIFKCALPPGERCTSIFYTVQHVPPFKSQRPAWCCFEKHFVQLQTQSEDEAIFIVIVIINPLIKVSFIHVNILPLIPSLFLKFYSLGWLLQALPAQILIKVSYKPRISNEPLFQIPLEIKIAPFSVALFISMVLFSEYRGPCSESFALGLYSDAKLPLLLYFSKT